MACEFVRIPGDGPLGGATAIVCGPRRKRDRCVSCGRPAGLLCDWKVPENKSGTCDAPICDACTHSPAPDKDLCPDHRSAWQARLAARGGK